MLRKIYALTENLTHALRKFLERILSTAQLYRFKFGVLFKTSPLVSFSLRFHDFVASPTESVIVQSMGRKCAFDRTAALDAALKAFWLEGYDKTTLEELLACMQIKTSSFYNSFESKEVLFFEVLQSYRQSIGRERLAFLIDDKLGGREALLLYFDHLVQKKSRGDYPQGCFMMKTAANLSDPQSTVGHEVMSSIAKLEKGFCAALRRGQKSKAFHLHFKPEEMARLLVISAYGISVLTRTKKSKKELLSSAYALIDMLTVKS